MSRCVVIGRPDGFWVVTEEECHWARTRRLAEALAEALEEKESAR